MMISPRFGMRRRSQRDDNQPGIAGSRILRRACRRRSGVCRFAGNPVAESFDVRLGDRRRLHGAAGLIVVVHGNSPAGETKVVIVRGLDHVPAGCGETSVIGLAACPLEGSWTRSMALPCGACWLVIQENSNLSEAAVVCIEWLTTAFQTETVHVRADSRPFSLEDDPAIARWRRTIVGRTLSMAKDPASPSRGRLPPYTTPR